MKALLSEVKRKGRAGSRVPLKITVGTRFVSPDNLPRSRSSESQLFEPGSVE